MCSTEIKQTLEQIPRKINSSVLPESGLRGHFTTHIAGENKVRGGVEPLHLFNYSVILESTAEGSHLGQEEIRTTQILSQ